MILTMHAFSPSRRMKSSSSRRFSLFLNVLPPSPPKSVHLQILAKYLQYRIPTTASYKKQNKKGEPKVTLIDDTVSPILYIKVTFQLTRSKSLLPYLYLWKTSSL